MTPPPSAVDEHVKLEVEPTPWRTVPGSAKYAHTSTATVKRAIRSEELTAYRVGARMIRIHTSDLDDWIRSRAAVKPVKKQSSKLREVPR